MLIGDTAKRTGVSVETIRFYERRQLIEQPLRPANGGYRHYPEATVQRIRFIKCAQQLGFSLDEANDLLTLESETSTECSDVRERALKKLLDVNEKIANLAKIRTVLERLIDACPGAGPVEKCSILTEIRDANLPFAPIGERD